MSLVGLLRSNAAIQPELVRLFSEALDNGNLSVATELKDCISEKKTVERIIKAKHLSLRKDIEEHLLYHNYETIEALGNITDSVLYARYELHISSIIYKAMKKYNLLNE